MQKPSSRPLAQSWSSDTINCKDIEKRAREKRILRGQSVLRIQGGCTSLCNQSSRDVWDILAQAAQEIESIYNSRRGVTFGSCSGGSSACGRSLNVSGKVIGGPENEGNCNAPGQGTFNAGGCGCAGQTFNLSSRPLNQTFDAEGSSAPLNQTFNLSDRTQSFCPHPALSSTPIRARGESISYHTPITYSNMDITQPCEMCGVVSPRGRKSDPAFTRAKTFHGYPLGEQAGTCANQTFSVAQGQGPSPAQAGTFVVNQQASPCANQTCNLSRGRAPAQAGTFVVQPSSAPRQAGTFVLPSSGSPSRPCPNANATYNKSAGGATCPRNAGTFTAGAGANATFDVGGPALNQTYDAPEAPESSFCPHPGLTSTPKRNRRGEKPTYRPYSEWVEYSVEGMERTEHPTESLSNPFGISSTFDQSYDTTMESSANSCSRRLGSGGFVRRAFDDNFQNATFPGANRAPHRSVRDDSGNLTCPAHISGASENNTTDRTCDFNSFDRVFPPPAQQRSYQVPRRAVSAVNDSTFERTYETSACSAGDSRNTNEFDRIFPPPKSPRSCALPRRPVNSTFNTSASCGNTFDQSYGTFDRTYDNTADTSFATPARQLGSGGFVRRSFNETFQNATFPGANRARRPGRDDSANLSCPAQIPGASCAYDSYRTESERASEAEYDYPSGEACTNENLTYDNSCAYNTGDSNNFSRESDKSLGRTFDDDNTPCSPCANSTFDQADSQNDTGESCPYVPRQKARR